MRLLALVLPPAPPPEAQAAVDAAARIAGDLAAAGRELHFRIVPGGQVAIELRADDGSLLRRLRPSEALELLTAR